ncbi:MAG: 50S ribosomal protein L21 [Chloroflexota bacterium]|nr:50S ribosomal protein L21 [Chloroflexota bacterium]
MYAIIKTGGKQYKVEEGQTIKVEKLPFEVGAEVKLDRVLLVAGDDMKVGRPTVEGAKVLATVVEQGKGKKVTIFKFKPKKHYKRKLGHRQPYTRLRIEKIVV